MNTYDIQEGTSEKMNTYDIQEDNIEELNIEDNKEGNYVTSYELSKPLVGMTFDTDDEAYNYYHTYARLVGFSIRKGSSHKSKVTGNIINRFFVCSKEGHSSLKRNIGKIVKQRRELRGGCLALLYVAIRKDGKWEVRKFHEEHNHMLSSPLKIQRLHSHKEISTSSIEAISELRECDLGPSLVDRLNMSGEPSITTQDCIVHLKTARKSNFGIEHLNIISYFQSNVSDDPGFFYRWELNGDGNIMNFFWADGRSRDSYLTFGDVVVFDATYRRKNLGMPFASFIGINHHMRSCLFGCALLADETEETFIWLFEKWSECMNGKHPICIITDQDVAMGNAIRKVFPNTKHIFCTWHIEKNAMIHLQDLYSRDNFVEDYNRWLYKSARVDEFEEGWFSLKQQYDIPNGHWLEIMYNKRKQ